MNKSDHASHVSGPAQPLEPLVIGADVPPPKPRFVPLPVHSSCPSSVSLEPGSEFRPLPVVRQARWHRLKDDVERQAHRIIKSARRRARQIISAARRQADEILVSAEQRVRDSIQREVDAFGSRAASLLQFIESQKNVLMERLEYEVAALAADIAGAVIRRKIQADDTIVLDVVRDALSQVADAVTVTVVVAPADESLVSEYLHKLYRGLQEVGKITVVSADEIERGGCLVHAEDATVDARIGPQIQSIKERLASALQAVPHAPHGSAHND